MSRPFVLDIYSPFTGHSLHEVTAERATIGRARTCAVQLDSLGVEPEHARFVRHGEDLLIEDLDSRAGVKVNGLRVTRRKLAPTDEIEIANFTLRLVEGAPVRAPLTSADAPISLAALQREAMSVASRDDGAREGEGLAGLGERPLHVRASDEVRGRTLAARAGIEALERAIYDSVAAPAPARMLARPDDRAPGSNPAASVASERDANLTPAPTPARTSPPAGDDAAAAIEAIAAALESRGGSAPRPEPAVIEPREEPPPISSPEELAWRELLARLKVPRGAPAPVAAPEVRSLPARSAPQLAAVPSAPQVRGASERAVGTTVPGAAGVARGEWVEPGDVGRGEPGAGAEGDKPRSIFGGWRKAAGRLGSERSEGRRAGPSGGVVEWIELDQTALQLGGMKAFKQWVSQRRDAFGAEAQAYGVVPPRGAVLLGLPGVGKRSAVRAAAQLWKLPLARLALDAVARRPARDWNAALEAAFQEVERAAPCVLFVDDLAELGRMAVGAGSGDAGWLRAAWPGASEVGPAFAELATARLLRWLEGRVPGVVVMVTASDAEALPEDLIRRGSLLDETFLVDLPNARERLEVWGFALEAAKRRLDAFDGASLARESDGRTGAEIAAAVRDGLHAAFSERRELTTGDLIRALDGAPAVALTLGPRLASLRRAGGRWGVPAHEARVSERASGHHDLRLLGAGRRDTPA